MVQKMIGRQLLSKLVSEAFHLDPMTILAQKMKEKGWEYDQLEYELDYCEGLSEHVKQAFKDKFILA